MAAKYWIKLYHEILRDRKMVTMDDHLWRRCIECFLMAGDYDQSGALPPLADMAFELRVSEERLETDLNELMSVGILDVEDGGYIVRQFAKRQATMPKAEYNRRRRNNEQSQEHYEDRYQSVTNGNTEKIREDIDIDEKLGGDFDDIQNMLSCVSRVLGLPVLHGGNDYNIQAAKEMVKNGIIEQDLQTGFDWLQSVGKTATSAQGLIGPATTAKNKRAKSKPVKTKPMLNMETGKYEDVPV